MGDEIDPKLAALIKTTQSVLGAVIKKPPLTDKLLARPPFRFIHDILTSVIRSTGFMKGLYTADEMNPENVKDKDAKTAFLQKAIDIVALATGESLAAKPTKIVAGLESDRTNEFLQALAAATKKSASNDDYVSRVLKGGKSEKAERAEKPPANEKEKEKDRKGAATEKDKDKDRDKEKEKERGRERDKTDEREREKTGARGEKGKDREKAERDKSRDVDRDKERDRDEKKRERDKDADRGGDKDRERRAERDRGGDPDRDRDRDRAAKDKDKDKDREKDKDRDREKEKASRSRDRDADRDDERRQDKADVVPGSTAKAEVRESTARRRPDGAGAGAGAGGQRAGEVSRTKTASPSRENGTNEEPDLPPQVANARRMDRVASARQGPPKPVAKLGASADRKPAGASGPAGTETTRQGIVIERENDDEQRRLDDEDAQFTVNTTSTDAFGAFGVDDRKPTAAAAPGDAEQHGALVKTMLDKKEQLKGGSQLPGSKVEVVATISEADRRKQRQNAQQEVDALRGSIQQLTRFAVPLGKLLDYVPEDLDTMQKELHQWRTETNQLAQQLKREQQATDTSLAPLRAQLEEFDVLCADQVEQNLRLKGRIVQNDEKLERIIQSMAAAGGKGAGAR